MSETLRLAILSLAMISTFAVRADDIIPNGKFTVGKTVFLAVNAYRKVAY